MKACWSRVQDAIGTTCRRAGRQLKQQVDQVARKKTRVRKERFQDEGWTCLSPQEREPTDKENESLGRGGCLDTVLVHSMDERGSEVDVKDGHDVGDMEEHSEDE